ncbi:hypothetical protein Acr_00g0058770 [Actinidia rufa]|uniref:Uncharacterized protein n=1 Tax=Actinidia rufa TaxID=165716 RepID=A0A7J0DN57_9ERIC|nr:hypothetical protein Acr_00g0058770 [Actinidia rufa]
MQKHGTAATTSTLRTEDEAMESDADVMSELGINISDDDQVITPKSRGRPTSMVWIHFDQVTRKAQTKPDRAKYVDLMYESDERVRSRETLVGMARKMKKKFDKYWGKVESMNMMMFIAIVLNPRFKLRYVIFRFSEIFDSVVEEELTNMVRDVVNRAFVEYEKFNIPAPFSTPSSSVMEVDQLRSGAIASEAAFSTGGRVVDQFRSSLSPKLVECLICMQDWLRATPLPFEVEEDMEQMQDLELALQKVSLNSIQEYSWWLLVVLCRFIHY